MAVVATDIVTLQSATLDGAQHVVRFDPKKHLAHNKLPEVLLMPDLGYAEDKGVSPVAVSEPFQLFTPEAIQIMRAEIFQPIVQNKYRYQSNIAACQIRGYAKEHAPFAYEAWNHPETLAIISAVAAVDLVPQMDYEIGHINLSQKTAAQIKEELDSFNKRKDSQGAAEDVADRSLIDDKPIVGWHIDSYPFVCVLMMSDCTNMIGGETAMRTADGGILKTRGPSQGCAVVMQGRYVLHQAMQAMGAQERITSVTSFRPKSPWVKDDTSMRTVRPVSDLSGLYEEFAEYRLEMMEARIRHERLRLAASRKAGETFDTLKHKKFLQGEIEFAERTDEELVEEAQISKGVIVEHDVPDAVVDVQERK